MCWSCAMTLLKVLLVLHAFSRAARISWVRFSVAFGQRARKYSRFKPHACFYSNFAKTWFTYFWLLIWKVFSVALFWFSFLTKTLKLKWKSSMDVCNLTLDINASCCRKRNLPFFWSQHITPWGAWRQLHWLETSVPLISLRPPEPVQANGRLPKRHSLWHICTSQFKGTQTDSTADETMTWTELYWDSTNTSTALSLSSWGFFGFFLLYVEWHAWFLCRLISGGFGNILSAIWLFT